MAKKKAAKPVRAARKRTHSKTHSDAPATPVNVMTDRRGTQFDPAKHAATAEGTPHADSAGNYIAKASHYDGAKKAHYGDTFRHA